MSWRLDGGGPVSAADVAGLLRERLAAKQRETWFVDGTGRSLTVVTNGERAMVMLLAGEGDPGEHAVDPGADGWSDGYVLANGQDDEYPDADTVPLPEALRIVEHVLDTGSPPPDAAWQVDR